MHIRVLVGCDFLVVCCSCIAAVVVVVAVAVVVVPFCGWGLWLVVACLSWLFVVVACYGWLSSLLQMVVVCCTWL